MIKHLLIVFLVCAGFHYSDPISAKANTVRLTIEGPQIDEPIVVSDRASTSVNVWGGTFVDYSIGPVAAPSSDNSRYVIRFYIEPAENTSSLELTLVYLVEFVWDEDMGRALVHIPGPDEPGYRLNRSTIAIEGRDGNWFVATEDWGKAVMDRLPGDDV